MGINFRPPSLFLSGDFLGGIVGFVSVVAVAVVIVVAGVVVVVSFDIDEELWK